MGPSRPGMGPSGLTWALSGLARTPSSLLQIFLGMVWALQARVYFNMLTRVTNATLVDQIATVVIRVCHPSRKHAKTQRAPGDFGAS